MLAARPSTRRPLPTPALVVAAVLLALVAGGTLAVRGIGARIRSGRTDAAQLIPRKIDINTATQAELELLPGVGEARARAVIAYREGHGPFDDLDDLAWVEGFGPATIDALREVAAAKPANAAGALPHGRAHSKP